MARQYSNVNGLDQAVSGFMDARKQKQDELYRQATQQMAAQEAALLKMGGYMKPTAPQDGYSSGFEENQVNVGRDQGPMEALAPQFFKKVVNPAQPAQAAFVKDVSPSGVPIRTYPDEPQRTPQSGPAPLLKGKEATKLDPLAAQADKVIYNEADKKLVGQKPDGTLQYAAPAVKTELSGLPGVALEGTPAVPATPEEAQNFNPSPMMRAKIQDRITSQASKDTDPEIPVNSLPPNLRSQLGIPEDFQGSIRSSILKEMIQGSYKAKPKDAESISPDIVNAVQSIEGGVPLSSAARSLQQNRGAGINPKEMSILQAAEARRNSKTMAESNLGFRKAEAETKKLQLSPKNEERILNLDTLKGNLENARNLVVSGKVRPRGELDIARRMGAYGGIPLEALNASLSAAGREPINDDEAQFLKLTANVNLSKLVEVAGTTFTERFGSMINSLGADITDAKRFNQNVDQMVGEIERAKGNIVNVGQANKAGNIRGQQGMTSAAPKEQVSHAPKEEDRGPKPAKWDASMLRKEKALAQKAIDAAKKSKNPDMTISMIKKTFKDNTGVDFDGK